MTTTTSHRWCHALATTTTIASATAKNENYDDRPGGRRGRRSEERTYNYFAFGSNMASSTMTNLRGITPLNSSAAVLPGHVLRFNVPGLPFVEPSSASVEPIAAGGGGASTDAAAVVHGVLYELSESDFGTICGTEGVPFVYALHRCRVHPYAGDGGTAGEDALRRSTDDADGAARAPDAARTTGGGVEAFALRASWDGWRRGGRDIPPSRSYMNVLVRGAREFALDERYLRRLEGVRCGKTFFGDGVAGEMLRLAEERTAARRVGNETR